MNLLQKGRRTKRWREREGGEAVQKEINTHAQLLSLDLSITRGNRGIHQRCPAAAPPETLALPLGTPHTSRFCVLARIPQQQGETYSFGFHEQKLSPGA